jgi:hypothetical protein
MASGLRWLAGWQDTATRSCLQGLAGDVHGALRMHLFSCVSSSADIELGISQPSGVDLQFDTVVFAGGQRMKMTIS